jgi:hypothetical protein
VFVILKQPADDVFHLLILLSAVFSSLTGRNGVLLHLKLEESIHRVIGEPLAFTRASVFVHAAAFSAFPQLRYS